MSNEKHPSKKSNYADGKAQDRAREDEKRQKGTPMQWLLHLKDGISGCKQRHFSLQYAAFCILKRHTLRCKMPAFTRQSAACGCTHRRISHINGCHTKTYGCTLIFALFTEKERERRKNAKYKQLRNAKRKQKRYIILQIVTKHTTTLSRQKKLKRQRLQGITGKASHGTSAAEDMRKKSPKKHFYRIIS